MPAEIVCFSHSLSQTAHNETASNGSVKREFQYPATSVSTIRHGDNSGSVNAALQFPTRRHGGLVFVVVLGRRPVENLTGVSSAERRVAVDEHTGERLAHRCPASGTS